MRGGRTRVVAGAVAAAVVAGALAGLAVHHHREGSADDAAAAAASSLARSWSAGDLRAARWSGTTPAAAATAYAAATSGLGGARPRVLVVSTSRHGARATAELAVGWSLGAGWRYRTTASLAPQRPGDVRGAWGARWAPSLVHPRLAAGQHLLVTRTAAARGEVLGRDGSPLVTDRPVVDVGVQPSRTSDPAGLASQLSSLLGVDAAALTTRIRSAAPTAFVPVITLREADYDALSAQLRPLAGTVFSRSTLPLAPTGAFARALIGRVGPATSEIVSASRGRVAAGDQVGTSGLQRTFDARLAGTPATAVTTVDAAGKTVATLSSSRATAGRPLRLTLDARVQEAADAALATATDASGATGGAARAALVAVDVPSGDVLAVANTPTTGADRALTGRYPPGSTFKTVTTTALLGTGLTPGTTVACPASATVDGRSFKNFDGEAFGAVDFRTDFAQSCNTAFVGLSSRLASGDLRSAAARLGLGGDWAGASGSLGVTAFTGSVPDQPTAVGRAAASIGQGTVLVSPLAMAVEAAAVARGSWTAPRLVAGASSSSASSSPSPDASQTAVVRDLMRSVVTSGTASALADVPGAPVAAKTGTAEHGSASPPQVHAWTIGFQGDTAFAVLVEDGTSGAATAVPVAESFLRALDG